MSKKIKIGDKEIGYKKEGGTEWFSLTDIAKGFGNSEPKESLRNWIRKPDTLHFMEEYEKAFNEDFKGGDFAHFKNHALKNSSKPSFKKYEELTGGKFLQSKSGRYDGGTWGCFDYAVHFMMWISSTFYVWFIRDYRRLKEQEHQQLLKNDKFYAQKNVDNLMESLRYEEERLENINKELDS